MVFVTTRGTGIAISTQGPGQGSAGNAATYVRIPSMHRVAGGVFFSRWRNSDGRATAARRDRQRHGRAAIARNARRAGASDFDITVLCEEPRPAYDRVQLTGFFSGKTRRGPVAGRRRTSSSSNGIDAASRTTRPSRSIASARRVTHVAGPTCSLRQAGAGHRLVSVRAADSRHATGRTASSIAPSKISKRFARRPRAAQGRRRSIGGGLLGLEAAKALHDLGLEDARRRVRAAPDGRAGRRRRRPRAAPEDRGAGRARAHRQEHDGNRRRRAAPSRACGSPTAARSKPT